MFCLCSFYVGKERVVFGDARDAPGRLAASRGHVRPSLPPRPLGLARSRHHAFWGFILTWMQTHMHVCVPVCIWLYVWKRICVKGFIGCIYNTYIRKHAYEEIFFDIRIKLRISESNLPHREESCYFVYSNTHFEPHRPCTRGRPRAGRRRSPSEYFRRDVAPKCQAPASGRLRSSAARDDVSAVSADAMATTFLCLRSCFFFMRMFH